MNLLSLPPLAAATLFDLIGDRVSWPFVLVVCAVLCVVFYRRIFQLFGVVIVPEDRIGLVTKKFVLFGANKEIPAGRIIATKGEAGFQAQTLAPGIYFWKWIWWCQMGRSAW